MNYQHIEQETVPKSIALHDCFCTHIQIERNQVYFEFDDGFVVLNQHPQNPTGKHIGTGKSALVFTHFDENIEDYYDILTFQYDNKTQLSKWYLSLTELIPLLNSRAYKIWFDKEYYNQSNHSLLLKTSFQCQKTRKIQECFIEIDHIEKWEYQWNQLRLDYERY